MCYKGHVMISGNAWRF